MFLLSSRDPAQLIELSHEQIDESAPFARVEQLIHTAPRVGSLKGKLRLAA